MNIDICIHINHYCFIDTELFIRNISKVIEVSHVQIRYLI